MDTPKAAVVATIVMVVDHTKVEVVAERAVENVAAATSEVVTEVTIEEVTAATIEAVTEEATVVTTDVTTTTIDDHPRKNSPGTRLRLDPASPNEPTPKTQSQLRREKKELQLKEEYEVRTIPTLTLGHTFLYLFNP